MVVEASLEGLEILLEIRGRVGVVIGVVTYLVLEGFTIQAPGHHSPLI